MPAPHRGTGFAGPLVGSPPREVANYTERSGVKSREAYVLRSKLANSTADFTSIFSNTRARCTSTVRTLIDS